LVSCSKAFQTEALMQNTLIRYRKLYKKQKTIKHIYNGLQMHNPATYKTHKV